MKPLMSAPTVLALNQSLKNHTDKLPVIFGDPSLTGFWRVCL